jgi:hypothetical protein
MMYDCVDHCDQARAENIASERIFFNGCRSYCCDLLSEDLSKLYEIKNVIDNTKFVAKFVRSHGVIKATYKRIMTEEKELCFTSFPILGCIQ